MGFLPQVYYDIKKFLKRNREIDSLFQEQYLLNKDKQIQHWNWWRDDAHSMWIRDFIVKRGIQNGSDKTIAICSVFGEREVLERVNADVRIFFSGENLHHAHMCQFADYLLSGKRPFDLALGFDCFEDKKYLRFPLWIPYLFAPDSTESDIRRRCDELCHPEIGSRNRLMALVARADSSGVRTEMYQQLSSVGRIDCPSDLFHNDDTLKSTYGDDKIAYLKQFRFNLCPENSSAFGYTTEKVFESVSAGCIPIYWGNECLDILNPSILLVWKRGDDNASSLLRIKELAMDERLYHDFVSQPWLRPDAAEYVIGLFSELESRFQRFF